MKKHIKIEVRNLGEGWGKVLRIVEQTHIGEEFGEKESSYFELNNFRLNSQDELEADEDTLFVRGSTKDRDGNVITVLSEAWLKKLRKIVKAYNKYYADIPVVSESPGGIEIIE